ncbi:MAG: hypothetical protein ABIH23_07615 [bacterium]
MMTTQQKIEEHNRFWRGEGPCLILIPTSDSALYDTEGYPERFENPRLMWESEMRRARLVLDWPTDGIPTVRPNLGVVFMPAIMGQRYVLREGQMPWCSDLLSRDEIRAAVDIEVKTSKMMRLAAEFYDIHRASGEKEIIAYHADTQGVFDVAHLLYGAEIFYNMADETQHAWYGELMDICLDLYLRVSRHLKYMLRESDCSMIHGHGTSQGVYFPNAGTRISEDTAILISPNMIEELIIPYIERSTEPFGGGFAHYCGYHEFLFERLCRSPLIGSIDLGNSEMFDCRWLLERCAESDTVLCSRVAALDGEDWPAYIRRIAGLIKETGARCILRPLVFPENRDECAAMQDTWHELTD